MVFTFATGVDVSIGGTFGKTCVCSRRTACSALGSRPSASRIVGAICAVSTGLVTVDISGIELFQAKADKDGKFGEEK